MSYTNPHGDLIRIYEGRYHKTPWYLRMMGYPMYRRQVMRLDDHRHWAYEYSETGMEK